MVSPKNSSREPKMTRRSDAPINVDYYFHAQFKTSQMSFIGVVPEPKSQMAQA